MEAKEQFCEQAWIVKIRTHTERACQYCIKRSTLSIEETAPHLLKQSMRRRGIDLGPMGRRCIGGNDIRILEGGARAKKEFDTEVFEPGGEHTCITRTESTQRRTL